MAKFYVRKQSDALFLNFEGKDIDKTARIINHVIDCKTPLIFINMLPEQEQNYVSFDIRAKIPPKLKKKK